MPPESPYREAIVHASNKDEELARAELEGDLDAGEEILWAGRPRQGIYLATADFLMIPFSLAWGGFSFFWEWSVATSKNAPVMMLCFGGASVCIGLYLIVLRFPFDAFVRARTFYALTTRRVLIASKWMTRNLMSIDLETVNFSLQERRDGSGTIVLGNPSHVPIYADSSWPAGTSGKRRVPIPPMLRRIANARAVLKQMRDAKERLRLPQQTDERDT
jgi:hypothetical protein